MEHASQGSSDRPWECCRDASACEFVSEKCKREIGVQAGVFEGETGKKMGNSMAQKKKHKSQIKEVEGV